MSRGKNGFSNYTFGRFIQNKETVYLRGKKKQSEFPNTKLRGKQKSSKTFSCLFSIKQINWNFLTAYTKKIDGTSF